MSNRKRMRRRPRQRKRKARLAPDQGTANTPAVSWADTEERHALVPGERPTAEQLAEMTRVYQENIRRHPGWAEMVQQLGEEEAERWLAPCRAELH